MSFSRIFLVVLALVLGAAVVEADPPCCSDAQADIEKNEAVALAVASSTLYDVHETLRLWQSLEKNAIDNVDVRTIVANSLVRHILRIGATQVDVQELKGRPLEALCLLTTDQTKTILQSSEDERLVDLALGVIDSVEEEVLERVHDIQESLLGTECYLSPRSSPSR